MPAEQLNERDVGLLLVLLGFEIMENNAPSMPALNSFSNAIDSKSMSILQKGKMILNNPGQLSSALREYAKENKEHLISAVKGTPMKTRTASESNYMYVETPEDSERIAAAVRVFVASEDSEGIIASLLEDTSYKTGGPTNEMPIRFDGSAEKDSYPDMKDLM